MTLGVIESGTVDADIASSVIASEAKQSIIPDMRDHGLLRRSSAKLLAILSRAPRNDGERTLHSRI
jgi:hypothetical protein